MSRWTTFFERASVIALASSLALASVAEGGASTACRAVALSILCVGCLLAVAGMASGGEWRWLNSRLWLLPLPVLVLGVIQLLPIPWPDVVRGAARSRLPAPLPMTLSVDRYATAEAILFTLMMLMAGYLAAHQVRSLRRLYGMTAVLFAVSAITVLGEWSGGRDRSQRLLGFLPIAPSSLPFGTGELWRRDRSIGPLAYQPWKEMVDAPGVDGLFFTLDWNEDSTSNATHRGVALALSLFPFTIAAALHSMRQSTGGSGIEWLSTHEGNVALLIVAMIAGAAALLSWTAMSWGLVLGGGVSLVALLWTCGTQERRRALAITGVALVAGIAPWLARWDRLGGWDRATADWRQWKQENVRILHSVAELGPFGGGLGTAGGWWPLSRPDDVAAPTHASSLLTHCFETGPLAPALFALTAIAILVGRRRTRPNQNGESRLAQGACLSALVGLLALGVAGAGLESPASLLGASVMIGLLSRSLASPNPWQSGVTAW